MDPRKNIAGVTAKTHDTPSMPRTKAMTTKLKTTNPNAHTTYMHKLVVFVCANTISEC